MIKNAITYIVAPGLKIDPDILGRRPAHPCGAFDLRTRGWVAPCANSTAGLVHTVGNAQIICLETESKLLPASVIRQVVNDRVEQIETDEDRKVGRKEMRELTEHVTDELLPKAFVQHQRTYAVLAGRYFIINASSQARADELMEQLFSTIDIHMRPIQTNQSPVSAMTGWMANDEAPAGFNIDSDLELRQSGEAQATIRYSHHALAGPEIAEHIAAGKMATKLGMTWNDRVSFVLTDKLHIKRIAFLDIIKEQVDEQSASAEELFDSDIAISVGEITQALDALVAELGGLVNYDDGELLKGAA